MKKPEKIHIIFLIIIFFSFVFFCIAISIISIVFVLKWPTSHLIVQLRLYNLHNILIDNGEKSNYKRKHQLTTSINCDNFSLMHTLSTSDVFTTGRTNLL